MATAEDRALPRIWFLVPFAAVPLAPWAVGLAIAALVTGAYVAMELVYGALGRLPAGEPDFWTRGDLRLLVPGALLLGYIPAAVCYGTEASERAGREVRALVRNSGAEIAAIAERDSMTLRGFRLAGLAGALLWIMLLPILSPVGLLAYRLHLWDHYAWFSFAVNLALFVMFAQVVYGLVRGSATVRLGDRLDWELDLLDLRPLRPLVRLGLTHALLCVVGISIVSLAFLDQPAERGEKLAFQAGVIAVILAAALAALLMPLRSTHRLIASRKSQELDALRAAIRGDRGALAATGLADQAEKLSLADLIAYRDLIDAVHEWPIERGTILRIVLYLGIPVGSWVGGALVERMVEALLG